MKTLLLAISLVFVASPLWAVPTELSSAGYLNTAFQGPPPSTQMIWLSGEIKTAYIRIMGHAPLRLRLRYWRQDQHSVWILNSIGKEQPITAAFTIKDGRIVNARVLMYRESRGWEIQQGFFTRQFNGAALNPSQQLDKNIDGITGATLSVRAMQRMARLALYLHQKTGDAS